MGLRDLDTIALRTFVTVADTGSFSETARRLFRTQSAISQQIKKLEDSTNHKLFRRQGSMVVLTREGEALLGYARQILVLSERARSFMNHRLPAQEIRLGAPDDYVNYLLSDSIAELQRRNPAATVTISCGNSRELRSRWEMNHLDICVIATEADARIGRTLRREALVWVAAEGWRPDAAAIPVAGFPNGCHVYDAMEAALDSINRPWRTVFTSNSILAIRHNVVARGSVTAVERSLLPPGTNIVDPACGLPKLPDIRIALLDGRGDSCALQAQLSAIICRNVEMQELAETAL